jgi:hypothetical protein
MKGWKRSAILVGLLPAVVACGGGGGATKLSPEDASGRKNRSGHEVSKEAAAGFDSALEVFLERDKKGDWSEAICKKVAEQFDEAADKQKSATNRAFPEALYNAGLDTRIESRSKCKSIAS